MTRISHRRHDLQSRGSRLLGHVISSSRLAPMLYLCHYRPVRAYCIGRTRRPLFLFIKGVPYVSSSLKKSPPVKFMVAAGGGGLHCVHKRVTCFMSGNVADII